jgi:hypothetical protein
MREERRYWNNCAGTIKIYGGMEPSRKMVIAPARQVTEDGGIDSLESIPGLLISLKIPALDKDQG